ncbi:hypothetical protein KKG48_03220 [Patescibacteria group bacterium]|nr:hypothetical protein [Patescibacteria group bacterium]
MDNYNNKRKGGGGKKFGGSRSFGGDRGGDRGGSRGFGGDRGGSRGFGGGRDGSRPEMHKATCSDCGNSCEVPFRPTGDKPVFCSDCFKNKRGDDSQSSRGGDRDFGGRSPRPRFDSKPSYQSDRGKESVNYKVQFDMLNTKLDKIIKALNIAVSEEKKEVALPKFEKSERAPKKEKKEVDTVALKKAIEKTKDKKPVAKKKTAGKKTTTKKKK